MKKSKIIATIFLIYHCSYSQELPQVAIDKISNNIIAYHIRHALPSDLGLDSSAAMFVGANLKVLNLIPNKSTSLQFTTTKVKDLKYPLNDWTLYSVYKRNFTLTGDSLALSLNLFSFDFDDLYLVAFKQEDSCIKYISGNFFHSLISDDFVLPNDRPLDWLPLVKLKTYYMMTENVSYMKEISGWFKYAAYSKAIKKNIWVYVNKANPDLVKVTTE